MKDPHVVSYTKECVYGIWEDIKHCGTDKRLYYPSMSCSYGNYQCPFETLCREDTPRKREAFFTQYKPTTKEAATQTED